MSIALFALVLAQKSDYVKANDGNVLYQTLIVASEGSGSVRLRRMCYMIMEVKRLETAKSLKTPASLRLLH